MLIDEARLVSRIRHPNVVPTLDVVAKDGELFLVMEYVQGESLGRLIRSPGAEDDHIPMTSSRRSSSASSTVCTRRTKPAASAVRTWGSSIAT